jgi:ABC-type glycerol-3-phosphate transport system substrate-binding protein
MVYARLDVNLALYVANCRGHDMRTQMLEELENTSFKVKLDRLLPAVTREYGVDPESSATWEEWLESANKLRCKRNDLIHGRWGIDEARSLVFNVIGLPGSPKQLEVTYTLDDLADEVELAIEVSKRFSELRDKWPT